MKAKRTNESQLHHYYASSLTLAADNHRRMAEMQRKAGMERLAKASEKTANDRQLAANSIRNGDVVEALDYADFIRKSFAS